VSSVPQERLLEKLHPRQSSRGTPNALALLSAPPTRMNETKGEGSLMAVLITKTGPGGTELLVRTSRLGGKTHPQGGSAAPVARQHTAWHLGRAVDSARRENRFEKLEAALYDRRQFWMDTCREVLEMQTASRQVLELHIEHGCRFRVPSHTQVQYILDALDSALPGWDRDHPELFYRTLELNFPELLHVRGVHRSR
jgi:hypothetical protein